MSNANNTVIKDVIDRIVDICYYSGTILELSVCAVIFGHFVKKKQTPLASAYFYILFWGYLFDAFYELGFTCQRYLTKDWNAENVIDLPWIKSFENAVEWYIMLFLGPANVMLSLNRFTSIFLITNHKIIWAKWFPLLLFALFVYPFIVGGFTFANIECRLDIYAPVCLEYFKSDFYRSAISNFVCAILSLIIGISTAIMYKCKFSSEAKPHTNQLKIEHKLLLQSVWSASLFGFFAFLGIFYPMFYEKKDDPEFFVMNRIYGFVQDLAYISYHYLSIILLFVFSPALKAEFLKFYHLQWIIPRRKSITITPTSQYNVSNQNRRHTLATAAIIGKGNQVSYW